MALDHARVLDIDFRSAAWKNGKARSAEELGRLHPSLIHALRAASHDCAEKVTILDERERREPEALTYAQIYDRARRVAASLRERGVRRGDRVMLILPTGHSFLAAFYGAQMLGAIAVPAYPPSGLRMESGLSRLAHIASHSGSRVCVVWKTLKPVIGELALRASSLESILLVEDLEAGNELAEPVEIFPEDIAFIQYTSGSTGNPKGVALTHDNLVANCHTLGQAVEVRAGDIMGGWCPLYHDMGLIGQVLFSMYWQIPLVLLPPTAFLRKPARWLRAISDYQISISTAPNFGYALSEKRIEAADCEGLDLSCWRHALNGAEPVNIETLRAFHRRFEQHGFRWESFMPVYGMAESSLAVAFPEPGKGPVTDTVDIAQLARGRAVSVSSPNAQRTTFVAVGRAVPGHKVSVVDEEGHAAAERIIGHVVTSGPSVMDGYFQDLKATSSAMRGGWLWTGDLGYVADGQLYITGRAKDLIIVRGKNYYAEDFEIAAEAVPGIRVGCTVAFGIYDQAEARDRVILVAETRETDDEARASMEARARELVTEACGIELDEVVLVEPGTVPKTSSGKRQRAECKLLYVDGVLRAPRTSKLYLGWIALRSKVGMASLGVRSRMRARVRGADATMVRGSHSKPVKISTVS